MLLGHPLDFGAKSCRHSSVAQRFSITTFPPTRKLNHESCPPKVFSVCNTFLFLIHYSPFSGPNHTHIATSGSWEKTWFYHIKTFLLSLSRRSFSLHQKPQFFGNLFHISKKQWFFVAFFHFQKLTFGQKFQRRLNDLN